MSVLNNVLTKMENGAEISEHERERAIGKIEKMFEQAEQRNLKNMQQSLLEMAERVANYEAPKNKPVPRALKEIVSDVEMCSKIVNKYKSRHDMKRAFEWARTREEFRIEFENARYGKIYRPDIRGMELPVNIR